MSTKGGVKITLASHPASDWECLKLPQQYETIYQLPAVWVVFSLDRTFAARLRSCVLEAKCPLYHYGAVGPAVFSDL